MTDPVRDYGPRRLALEVDNALRTEWQTFVQSDATWTRQPLSSGLHAATSGNVAAAAAPRIVLNQVSRSRGPGSRIFQGPRWYHLVAVSAASACIPFAIRLYYARNEDRPEVFKNMIWHVGECVAIAAGSSVTCQRIVAALDKKMPQISQALLKGQTAQLTTLSLAGVSGAIAGVAHFGMNCFTSLWNLILAALSGQEERGRRLAAVKELWTMDQLIQMCSSIASGVAVSLTPIAAAGFFPQALAFAVVSTVLSVVINEVLEEKNEAGGWLPWLGSFFSSPTRQRHWEGPLLDLHEDEIPRELICPISHQLVVDPVVGGPGGRIYERAYLYQHLRSLATDPLTNLPANANNYRTSSVARRYAQIYARRLQATLV